MGTTLLNNSSHPIGELSFLTEFVCKYFDYSDQAQINVGDPNMLGYYGQATPLFRGYVVNIFMEDEGRFPLKLEYRTRSGHVILTNWQEFYVFILSHELRHVSQWASLNISPKHYEVDAELAAKYVLQEFRRYCSPRNQTETLFDGQKEEIIPIPACG